VVKKINITKRSASVLIVSTVICLILEPVGYYQLYLNSFHSKWGGIIFSSACIVVILSAKSYLPNRPGSLEKWLHFMAIAFCSKVLGQLSFKIYANTLILLLFYSGATIFFLLSLSAAIVTYKNVQAHNERG